MADEWEEIPQNEFYKEQKKFLNSKEGFISNLVQSAKHRKKEITKLGNVSEENNNYPGTFGGQAGKILGRTAVDLPAITIAGATGLPGLLGLLGYGYATSSGKTTADKFEDALMTAAPVGITKIRNIKIPKSIRENNLYPNFSTKGQSLKDVYEIMKKPQKIEEEIEALKPEKAAVDLSHREKMEDFIKNIDDVLNQKTQGMQNIEEDLNNVFGDKSNETLRNDVFKTMHDVKKQIEEQSKENYKKFSKEYGGHPIKNPINFENIDRDFGLSDRMLKDYPELKPIIDRLKGPQTIGKQLGQKQPIEHSVDDYLTLYRTLRDLGRDNKNQSLRAIGAEKAKILHHKKIFDALRKEVEQAKISSLNDEGKESLKKAQDFYRNNIAKLREHFPSQAIFEKGKVPNNYFDVLNQPGIESVRAQIYQNPNAVEAISKHALMNKDFSKMTADSINNLLNSDLGAILPRTIKSKLRQYAEYKKDISNLTKLKSESSRPRTRTVDAAMKEIFHHHPEFEKPFSNLKEMQARMLEIERELIRLGLSKKEAEAAAAKYWKIVSVGKTIKNIKHALRKWIGI